MNPGDPTQPDILTENQAAARADGLLIQAPRWQHAPGLRHGVTTRQALPQPGKDDFFNTLRRAREVGAIPYGITFGTEQVHGDHIETVFEPREAGRQPDGFRCDEALEICEFPATDALITTLPGVTIVIQTADCLPVFIVDRVNLVAGLAHCGWRGLRANLTAKLLREMINQGAGPDTMEAWLAPCIRVEHYEVGSELVAEFTTAFAGAPVSTDGTHLNLPAIARWQLEQAGLEPAQIMDSGECTRCHPDRYHSYRAEAQNAGRLLSFVGFTETAEPLRG